MPTCLAASSIEEDCAILAEDSVGVIVVYETQKVITLLIAAGEG
jgi:hypothetical protein